MADSFQSSLFVIVGSIFPFLSLLTGLLSLYERTFRKRNVSPLFVPFFGPILLDVGLVLREAPWWSLVIPWILDIGTIAFLIITPRLIREWWQTSRFTLVSTLIGEQGIQTAVITLHSTGVYLLRKEWRRAAGEFGVTSLGELGRFTPSKTGFDLHADYGWSRTLHRQQNNMLSVEETENVNPNCSLKGFDLRLV